MSNINNHGVDMNNKQIKDLYSIEAVQDLDHEAAATISGGALILIDNPDLLQGVRKFTKAERRLGPIKNKASAFEVTGNRDWIVYTGENFIGNSRRLKPGQKGRFTGPFNDNIASVKPV